MLSLYLAVLDDQSKEEQFIDLHYFVSVIKACKPSECVDRTSMEWDVVLFSGIFRCHLYGNAVRFFAGYRSLYCMESIKWKC